MQNTTKTSKGPGLQQYRYQNHVSLGFHWHLYDIYSIYAQHSIADADSNTFWMTPFALKPVFHTTRHYQQKKWHALQQDINKIHFW